MSGLLDVRRTSAIQMQHEHLLRITPTSLRRTGRARLHAIQLYGQPRNAWLERTLSLIGEIRFTGCGLLTRLR
jgi:hypothetical protein